MLGASAIARAPVALRGTAPDKVPPRAIIRDVDSQVTDRESPAPSRSALRPPPPRVGSTGPSSFGYLILPHLVAGLLGVMVAIIPDPVVALRVLCGISCTYAVFMVSSRGRAYLVPSGVYFLASGAFIGLASLYLTQVGSLNEYSVLRDWAVVAFLTTVASAIVVVALSVRWHLYWPSNAEMRAGARQQVPRSPVNFQLTAVILVGISQIPQYRGLNIALANATGIAGVMMLVLAAASRRVRMRWHGDAVLVALAVVIPIIWVQLEFEGGGRLTLAGLGIATLVAWSLVRPRRAQKIAVVLAIPVFLIFSGLNRLEKDGARNSGSSGVLTSGDGLASMYGPLDTWTELVQLTPEEQIHTRSESVGPRYGKTFLNTLLLPIPRTMWEDKPKGFGAELTEILRAKLLREDRIASEHSMAALINGEFYVNFGVPGLILLPFAVGWFLAVLDRFHARVSAQGLQTVDDWFHATILVCLVSSLGDLFWVGTFTFMSRAGLAAVIAWIAYRLTTRRTRVLSPRVP
jgi:hypothetical protein